MRVLGPGTGLAGGYLYVPPREELEDRRAALFRLSERRLVKVYEGPGWVVGLDFAGSIAWAVIATPQADGSGPDFWLLFSGDSGLSWREVGSIPARSITSVLAVNEKEAWVLGAYELMRTTDSGDTWQSVEAPGIRNAVVETLAKESGTVLLLSRGVSATRDRGRTWIEHALDGAQVCGVSGAIVLARVDSQSRIGLMASEDVMWIVSFDKAMIPFRVVVHGRTVRFLALPGGDDSGKGVLLYESTDNAKSWQGSLVSCFPTRGAIDVGPTGFGMAVDGEGHVLIRT